MEKKPAKGGIAASARAPTMNAPVCPREGSPEPAHAADVLLVGQGVDDDAGSHEEQRLEEGVRHQVEHARPVGPEADGGEHVADLAHRRVRDHALDVRLHERDEPGEDDRHRAEDPG